MKELLCIGGPCDGEYRRDPEGSLVMRVAEIKPLGVTLTRDFTDADKSASIHEYRQQMWQNPDGTRHRIWIHSSLAEADLMQVLLKGYRQPKIANGGV